MSDALSVKSSSRHATVFQVILGVALGVAGTLLVLKVRLAVKFSVLTYCRYTKPTPEMQALYHLTDDTAHMGTDGKRLSSIRNVFLKCAQLQAQ